MAKQTEVRQPAAGSLLDVSDGWPARQLRQALLSLVEGRRWVALRLTADLVMLVCGCIVGLAASSDDTGAWALVAFVPLALALLHARGRYIVAKHDHALDNVAPGVGAISISAMAIFTAQLVTSGGQHTFGPLMAWTWGASLIGVTFVGVALPVLQRSARRRRLVVRPTLIVGTDVTALDLAMRLERRPEYGLRAVGFLAQEQQAPNPNLPPVLGTLDDLQRVVSEHGIRTVIVGFPDADHRTMLSFIARCDALGLQTNIVPRFSAAVNHQTRFEYLGTVPLLNMRAMNPDNWRFAVKHGLDRVFASLFVVVLSPLLIAIAIAIKLSSPGPVLYRQQRAGRDGTIFNLLKFRTMIDADDAGAAFALVPGMGPGGVEGVDRRTRVGRLLRKTSLDELPQLFNVLRGEMSIIGPRPERPEFAELFRMEIERYHDRQRVRSGITGWAQVHGLRGQTPMIDRIEFDNFYIEHWSLALDLRIALMTIPALLRGS